jgi:hypothetical protein
MHTAGTGALAADRGGGGMRGRHLSGDPRADHVRHAFDRRDRGGYYDYGYGNSCFDYPAYYQQYPWNCY